MKAWIVAMAALAANDFRISYGERASQPQSPEERNKHKLTPEQRAKMSQMSPKEKKRYLKGLK